MAEPQGVARDALFHYKGAAQARQRPHPRRRRAHPRNVRLDARDGRSEYIADILVERAERDLRENADWLGDELLKEQVRREGAIR